jgi:transcriptional regulator with XRE-family HTH domain
MPPVKSSPVFREWLSEAVATSGLKKREIARRMAAKHPRGVNTDTIETARRTVNKILAGDLTPTQPTRDWIADALDRDDAPSVASEDDDDEESDLSALLHSLVREQADLSRKLTRALRAVGA